MKRECRFKVFRCVRKTGKVFFIASTGGEGCCSGDMKSFKRQCARNLENAGNLDALEIDLNRNGFPAGGNFLFQNSEIVGGITSRLRKEFPKKPIWIKIAEVEDREILNLVFKCLSIVGTADGLSIVPIRRNIAEETVAILSFLKKKARSPIKVVVEGDETNLRVWRGFVDAVEVEEVTPGFLYV